MNSPPRPRVAFHGEPERSERGGAKRGRLRPLRLGAILILSTLLCACGFQPLHGQQYRSSLKVDLSSVIVDIGESSTSLNSSSLKIPRRYDELLRAEITDATQTDGKQSEKQFRLTITYSEQEMALFVNPDGTASRGDIIYTSSYVLTRLSDQKTVASGSLQRVSSYNSSQTADYASYVSIEDARRRGIIELAQDYKLRLAALLPTLNSSTLGEAKPEIREPVPQLQPLRHYETYR